MDKKIKTLKKKLNKFDAAFTALIACYGDDIIDLIDEINAEEDANGEEKSWEDYGFTDEESEAATWIYDLVTSYHN